MVGTEGLLPNDSLALSSRGGIGNSTNDLMSGSLLTDATLGESNDLTALSRTSKTSSSGGGEPSPELAELNASAATISQAKSSLDIGQNHQSFTFSPASSTTKPVEAADADPLSGQVLNALAVNDSVENSQTSSTPTIKYLSDLDWISANSGWGPIEKDISNGQKQAGDGQKIILNGKSYNKGLGTHSASEIRYALDGNYTSFRSDIGIDDEVGAKGSATFQVWADGAKLFESGLMKGDSATKQVDVDLTGKQELKLVVTDGGDKKSYDHADWADARLIGQKTSGEGDPKPMPETDSKSEPTPPPSRGSSDVIFYNGFEKGLEGFEAETRADYSAKIVNTPTRAGDQALKFTYKKSDADYGAKRSELRMEPVPAGSERWYGVSIFVPKDFKETEGSIMLTQFHSKRDKGERPGSPPLFLETYEGKLRLGNRWDHRKLTSRDTRKGENWDLGPLPKGQWIDFAYHIKWSYKSDGLLEVFQDGKKVVSKRGPNNYNDKVGPYMKIGMYASGIGAHPEKYKFKQQAVYYDEVRMAGANARYEDIAPNNSR